MARTNLGGPDEALAGMAKVGKPRVPMGNSASKDVSFPSAKPGGATTKLVKKGGAQAADPTVQAKPQRRNTTVERKGAAYGIKVNMPAPVSPESSATQSNGRVIRSAVNRSNQNFGEGNSTSY